MAGQFYDAAKATYTTLIDRQHLVSTLYNMTNVPTGVWIDESGRIVRPNEVAYSRDVTFLEIKVNGSEYANALRDWVAKGSASEYALTPEQVAERLKPRTAAEGLAEANFQLGVYFHDRGEAALADRYWQEAERLRPDSWNYHRQDWSFTPAEAGANWMAKFRALGDQPYYPPLELERSLPE